MPVRGKLSSKWTTVLLVLAFGWLALQAGRLWFRTQHVDAELARLQDRAYQIERDIERQEQLAEQAQDVRWLEHQARMRLNYKFPDEQVAVVYKDEKAGTITPAASASGAAESTSWWVRIMSWLRD
jgi:type II secretory pathway component PulJ